MLTRKITHDTSRRDTIRIRRQASPLTRQPDQCAQAAHSAGMMDRREHHPGGSGVTEAQLVPVTLLPSGPSLRGREVVRHNHGGQRAYRNLGLPHVASHRTIQAPPHDKGRARR